MLYGKYPLIFPRWPDLPVLATAVGCQRISDDSYRYSGYEKGDDCSLVQVTLSGRGCLKLDGHLYEVGPGSAMILSFPMEGEYYWEQDGEAWEFIYINLIGSEAQRVCQKLIQSQGHVVEVGANDSVVQKLKEIIEMAERQEIQDPYSLSSLCYRLIMELEKLDSFTREHHLPDFLNKSVEYIQGHISEDISVQELASLVDYSRFHFARAFKEKMNISPLEYINRLKMEKAVEYLREGSAVNEVSELVGYKDASYFCKVFKQHYKISPGKFSRSSLYQR